MSRYRYVQLIEIRSEGVFSFPYRVSNGMGQYNFWDNGTEFSSLSRDKGTTGQAQNLAKGRDEPGQPVNWGQDAGWDGMSF